MNRKYCLDKKEWEEAQAALLLAKQFGLIEDAGIEALEKRRAKKNKENSLYGVRFYSPALYLQAGLRSALGADKKAGGLPRLY